MTTAELVKAARTKVESASAGSSAVGNVAALCKEAQLSGEQTDYVVKFSAEMGVLSAISTEELVKRALRRFQPKRDPDALLRGINKRASDDSETAAAVLQLCETAPESPSDNALVTSLLKIAAGNPTALQNLLRAGFRMIHHVPPTSRPRFNPNLQYPLEAAGVTIPRRLTAQQVWEAKVRPTSNDALIRAGVTRPVKGRPIIRPESRKLLRLYQDEVVGQLAGRGGAPPPARPGGGGAPPPARPGGAPPPARPGGAPPPAGPGGGGAPPPAGPGGGGAPPPAGPGGRGNFRERMFSILPTTAKERAYAALGLAAPAYLGGKYVLESGDRQRKQIMQEVLSQLSPRTLYSDPSVLPLLLQATSSGTVDPAVMELIQRMAQYNRSSWLPRY